MISPHFQVVEFYYRLMKNADYDIKEKSDIEVLSAFEGSGVSGSDAASDVIDYPVVDESFEEQPKEGSTEL